MRHRLAQAQLRPCGQCSAVQEAVQIGAVNGGVRRTVLRDGALAQWQRAQDGAALGVQTLQALGEKRHLRQSLAQAPSLQAARGVGPELHARPHFAEHGGLFGHGDRRALARASQGRGQAADAGARDQHRCVFAVAHAGSPINTGKPCTAEKSRSCVTKADAPMSSAVASCTASGSLRR